MKKVQIIKNRGDNMIKAGIVGATGYAGQELVRLLSKHPDVIIKALTSRSYTNQKFQNIYNNYTNIIDIECVNGDLKELAKQVDVIFLALPHGIASKQVNEEILKNVKIIDLGADFRFKNEEVYENWYGTKHENPKLLEEAVYGLSELNRDLIKEANLIGNPGCYTTCSILSLTPLIKEGIIKEDSIIIDAKSGVTGAGRSTSLGTLYSECNESIKAYKIASHRHTPEIEEQLNKVSSNGNINLVFTPHLIPMNRGILVTAYASLNKEVSYDEVKKIYKKYYGQEQFIRLLKDEVYPETRWVKGSNYCDINFKIDKRTNRIIVIGAIDNLIKGAAGQAVQNMNIMFGLKEDKGIDDIPLFPI